MIEFKIERFINLSHISLRCFECGALHSANMTTLRCKECGGVLDIAYNSVGRHAHSYDARTPMHSAANAISLGEGNTPVVPISSIAKRMGIDHLHTKLEMMNPTGSFKDRGTAILMSAATESGVEEVVEDSSGNAGASVAAYAARAGIRAHIFAPASAPAAKLQQISVYGATTHLIEGDRQAVTEAAIGFAERNSLVYASHNLSPFFTEGTKSFAYELVEQSRGNLPRHIVIPVGNGSLLIGAHTGFTELKQAGHISAIPKLYAVQARAVMPLAAAFAGENHPPPPAGSTIAGGIAVVNPPRLRQCLYTLRDTGGSAIAVEDEDIIRWHRTLAMEEGIFVEPTSAAALAGAEVLVQNGTIPPNESVVAVATGFGLKDAIPS